MNFRIKEHKKGFVVEILKTKWYNKKYWTHYIDRLIALKSVPLFFPSYKIAEQYLLDKIKLKTKENSKSYDGKTVYVTIDWSGRPITTKNGYTLPREAEMIINGKYYPNNKVGEWPCDPKTGEELETAPRGSHIGIF